METPLLTRLLAALGLLVVLLGCAGGAIDQPEVCDEYIECASVAAPTELGDLDETYGRNGTCWQGDEDFASTCERACESGLADLRAIAPEAEECGGESGACVESDANESPVADAGDAISDELGSPIQLNGSGSHDPDGDDLLYHWALDAVPEGSDVATVLSSFSDNDSTAAGTPTFLPDVEGTYVLTLAVEDCVQESAPAYVVVSVY